MLRELKLRGFKRFQDESLPFSALTLLTGFNSGGKSSTVQALQLLGLSIKVLHQDRETLTVSVPLNKDSLALGDLRAVVNETISGNKFSIEASGGDSRIIGEYGGGESSREDLAVNCKLSGAVEAAKLSDSLCKLRFVPADRFGPAEVYPLLDSFAHEVPGVRAKMAFGNLWHLKGTEIRNSELRHPDATIAPSFERQVEAWLQELFPGVTLEARPVQYANLMSLGIRTNAEYGFHRPTHVGFGITYALPVLISLLLARPGDIVLIESPESHLHPRAQSRIGRLFAQAAAAGVQVVVESHSDHVLNGMRVAVHDGELAPENVSILFFSEPSAPVRFEEIRIKADGRLSRWPSGFFDESDKLLDRLLEPPGRETS